MPCVNSISASAWPTSTPTGLSGRSLQRNLSAWRQFFTWLGARRLVSQNPVATVRAPKSARKLPKTLDVDEMGQFLNIPADSPLALRDRAMLELFYSSGLRLSELATLSLSSLNLEEGLVRVTGKGNKVRLVPVGKLAIAAVRDWLKQHPDLHSATAPLFPGPKGKSLTHVPSSCVCATTA
jgi:integrase/recombinase XerC